MAVVVKIIRRRVWRKVSLESHSCNDSGGKGGSYPARSDLKNAASQGLLFPMHICDKQIVRAVNSQTIWISQSRRKDASHPGRSKFINCPVDWGVVPRIAAIRHKQIAPAVKGQSKWPNQARGKSGSYSVRSKF